MKIMNRIGIIFWNAKNVEDNLLFQILYRRQSKNKKHLPVTIEPTIKALRYVIVGTNSKKVVIVFLEKN